MTALLTSGPHTTAQELADLDERSQQAVDAGSARGVAKQHAQGKGTARERIDQLLDPGSLIEFVEFVEFVELARHRSTMFELESNRPAGDGVITGFGTVDGRPVCVFSQDVTIFGGAPGVRCTAKKIVETIDSE
jgi:propionyl-CoA carboxylase beta chain